MAETRKEMEVVQGTAQYWQLELESADQAEKDWRDRGRAVVARYRDDRSADSFGAGLYICNGLAGVTSLDFISTYIQEIELSTGWGIWSTYIDPVNSNLSTVFSSIASDVVIVKNQSGNVYWPSFGLNSIGNIIPRIKIYM